MQWKQLGTMGPDVQAAQQAFYGAAEPVPGDASEPLCFPKGFFIAMGLNL